MNGFDLIVDNYVVSHAGDVWRMAYADIIMLLLWLISRVQRTPLALRLTAQLTGMLAPFVAWGFAWKNYTYCSDITAAMTGWFKAEPSLGLLLWAIWLGAIPLFLLLADRFLDDCLILDEYRQEWKSNRIERRAQCADSPDYTPAQRADSNPNEEAAIQRARDKYSDN